MKSAGFYDEMSPRSYPDYAGGTTRQRALRQLLREAMEGEGFTYTKWSGGTLTTETGRVFLSAMTSWWK